VYGVSGSVTLQRSALLALVRSSADELWLVTPSIREDGLALILPFLQDRPVRVITLLDAEQIASGRSDMAALSALRALPGCEMRHLTGLEACLYAARGGMALVSAAPLSLAELDNDRSLGWLTREFDVSQLETWWALARAPGEQRWQMLVDEVARRIEARAIGDDLRRIGAFIALSARGTRRTRRLDPREFGVSGDWGRAVRPVEVALYQLDDVRRTREELESILARHGIAWNGLFLVPRHFLEKEWPRQFQLRERALKERLRSPEGQAALKEQLVRARSELTAFFTELYGRLPEPEETPVETWVNRQVTAVLADVVSDSILEGGDLEYRVLQIEPEDEKSARELRALLEDPKLRSLQLTFDI
jgi:hypothetical protein